MVDNYLVRSLLGEAAFHAPVGAIGARPHLLRLAQQQLAQFDLIMLLEQVGCGCHALCDVSVQDSAWSVGSWLTSNPCPCPHPPAPPLPRPHCSPWRCAT